MVNEHAYGFLGRRWWLVLARGLVLVAFGLIFLLWPIGGLMALVLLFGIFCIVDGLTGLAASFGRARGGGRWVWLAVEAVATIVVGIIILALPPVSLLAFYLIVAIRAGLSGLLMLMVAFRLDGRRGQGAFLLGGLFDLLFAGFLLFAPALGLVAMGWWVGVWAIALGVLTAMAGLHLRAARHPSARYSSVRGRSR